jgi:pSer/pThr/pTyr-binding forkhead associated (FHA) protein
MRLLFPNGEHAPVELKDGLIRIGAGAASDVLIAAPGIAPQHCEIECSGGNATLRVTDAGHVVVNGRQASGEIALKPGDLVLFGKVGARVTALNLPGLKPRPAPAPAPAAAAPEDDDGRTRIRMALPRFVLRGVSGSTFGKTYPLYGSMTVGRASDCDLSIPGEEISRKHARLKVMPEGVEVEDLGSSNGTFINGKRISTALAHNGDELRLDTVRFMLVAPGQEIKTAQQKSPSAAATAPGASASGDTLRSIGWVVLGVALAALVIAGLSWLGFVRI